MEKISILGINGSPHQRGIVSELLGAVLAGAKEEGAEVKTVELYNLKISHSHGYYSEDSAKETASQMPQDDMTALYPEIIRADGLVLATPVYWANMSGVMKDFIDRLTPLENDGFKLKGKIGAFIAASKENHGGTEMAMISMVAALGQMGVLIPPGSMMWHPGGWSKLHKQEWNWAEADAPNVGKSMVKLIKLLRQNPIDWGI